MWRWGEGRHGGGRTAPRSETRRIKSDRLKPGESVVIYGCGPVGLMAAHSAMIKGAAKVFIIDRHPELENVWLAAGFSGHGFKFAPSVGETLAELAVTGRTAMPIDFLGLGRFRV